MTGSGHSPAVAAARAALVLVSALVLAGCGTRADGEAIAALVDGLMQVLAPSDGTTAEKPSLSDIFFGIDDLPGGSLPAGFASASGIRSHDLRRIAVLPFGRAAITVDVRGDGTSGTMELRARRIRGQWRLDPSIRFEQKLGEIKRADS